MLLNCLESCVVSLKFGSKVVCDLNTMVVDEAIDGIWKCGVLLGTN